MIPDTCPYCGAPTLLAPGGMRPFRCGTALYPPKHDAVHQSPECARYVRTRISLLKRMARAALDREMWHKRRIVMHWDRHHQRSVKFSTLRSACLREIDRLKAAQP